MKEKKNNTSIKGDNNLLIYITLIIIGIISISLFSLYIPVLIFTLLFLTPLVLKYDMEMSKPILSVVLAVVCGLFLYLSKFNYSIYRIMVVSTGLTGLASFLLWRFSVVDKFIDGIKYSILISVCLGAITALIVFLIGGRQPFSLQIVDALKKWILESESAMVNQYLQARYEYITLIKSSGGTFYELLLARSGLLGLGSDVLKVDKIEIITPYLESDVSMFSIGAMIFYPAFAGIITWWRGNYRYYKNMPMTDETKNLKPKPFAAFTIPKGVFGITVLMLLLSFIFQTTDSAEVLIYAGSIMQNFAYLLLAIQGLAIIEYFLKRIKIFKYAILRIIIMLIVGIFSGGALLIFIGGIDLFINIRTVYSKVNEMKEKTRRNNLKNKNKNNNHDSK